MKITFKTYGKDARPVTVYNSRGRLAFYRDQAADVLNIQPNAKHWRHWRRRIFNTPNNARGDKGEIFTDSVEQYGEYLGDVADVMRPHSRYRYDWGGWYADNYQQSTITGGVAKLRSARGTFYVPVTHCDDWDGVTFYLADAALVPKGEKEHEHEKAIISTAYVADNLAESEAEKAREVDAEQAREQQIEEARETIHALNRETLELLKAIKASGKDFAAPVCNALRAQVSALLARRSEQFQIIEGD